MSAQTEQYNEGVVIHGDVFSEVTSSAENIMGEGGQEPTYKLRVILWAEIADPDGKVVGALQLKKLGRVYHDAGKAERIEQQMRTILQMLQIEERGMPALGLGWTTDGESMGYGAEDGE